MDLPKNEGKQRHMSWRVVRSRFFSFVILFLTYFSEYLSGLCLVLLHERRLMNFRSRPQDFDKVLAVTATKNKNRSLEKLTAALVQKAAASRMITDVRCWFRINRTHEIWCFCGDVEPKGPFWETAGEWEPGMGLCCCCFFFWGCNFFPIFEN